MAITRTTAQMISRLLRQQGYNPQSTGDSTQRWVALACTQSADEVRVRVWSDYTQEEPSEEDCKTTADIAALLTQRGYKIRYNPGAYYLYVSGKES